MVIARAVASFDTSKQRTAAAAESPAPPTRLDESAPPPRLREVKTGSKTDGDRTILHKIDKANRQIKDSGYLDGDGNPEVGEVDIQLRGDAARIPFAEVQREVTRQFNSQRSRSLVRVRVFQEGRLVGEWNRGSDGAVTGGAPDGRAAPAEAPEKGEP